MEEVLKSLRNLEKQNNLILESLARLNLGKDNLSNKLYEPLPGFPLSTVIEFKDLDSNENKEKRQKLHDHLLRIGGVGAPKLKEFLYCALIEVMTDELVTKFTWHKTKEIEQFSDTKISNTLYQAAVKCPLFLGPESKEIFKQVMLDVIKITKQRFRNKLKSAAAQARSNLEMEEIKEQVRELTGTLDSQESSADESEDADDELF